MKTRDVRRRFDAAASAFDAGDFVYRATFEGLVERLEPLVIQPDVILDLGAATGRGSRRLGRKYRKSRVISFDLSAAMLRRGRSKRRLFSRVREVQGDASRLPFAAGSIDLVFANMLLPWINDLEACFAETQRVLRKDGLFAFATAGPDSLGRVRDAWSEDGHVRAFPDMHDVGDALVRAGLADPVLDVDKLTITHREPNALISDLGLAGARNTLAARRKTLTGKDRLAAMKRRLAGGVRDGVIETEIELVYGHAWATGPRPEAGEYLLDPGAIGRRRRG